MKNADNRPMGVCARCKLTIYKIEHPWDVEYDDTDIGGDKGRFFSEWVNNFGFPWCPDTGTLKAHTPKTNTETED